LSYAEAKAWARNSQIRTSSEWRSLSRERMLPLNIPSFPIQTYRSEWEGWSEFLGTGTKRRRSKPKRIYRSYSAASAWAKKEGIRTSTQWKRYRQAGMLPADIPSNPEAAYSDEWQSWGEFLGTGRVANTK